VAAFAVLAKGLAGEVGLFGIDGYECDFAGRWSLATSCSLNRATLAALQVGGAMNHERAFELPSMYVDEGAAGQLGLYGRLRGAQGERHRTQRSPAGLTVSNWPTAHGCCARCTASPLPSSARRSCAPARQTRRHDRVGDADGGGVAGACARVTITVWTCTSCGTGWKKRGNHVGARKFCGKCSQVGTLKGRQLI
jgi:hypothetical protein